MIYLNIDITDNNNNNKNDSMIDSDGFNNMVSAGKQSGTDIDISLKKKDSQILKLKNMVNGLLNEIKDRREEVKVHQTELARWRPKPSFQN